MSNAQFARLPDRGAVRVAGPDAVKFLQGLVTNDVGHLEADAGKMAFDADRAFAALLSPQGKVLFDFLCVPTPEGFVLDVARDQAQALVKRLTMYRLRAAVEITDVSDTYVLLALWGKDAVSSGPTTATLAFKDPRHADLGIRILAEARFATDIGSATNGSEVDAGQYHAHRVALGVPEGGKDYAFGDTFPHEAMLDLLSGVSFTKGCYVGQEIVARMEHRGTARKRIVIVHAETALPAPGCEIRAGEVAIGMLGSVDGHRGLAMLRLDRVKEFQDKGVGLTAGNVPVTIEIPAWAATKLHAAAS